MGVYVLLKFMQCSTVFSIWLRFRPLQHMAHGILSEYPPDGCEGSGDLTPDDHDSPRVLHTLETGCYRAASSVKPELSPPQKVNFGVHAVSLVGFRGPADKQRGSCLEENTALSSLAQVALWEWLVDNLVDIAECGHVSRADESKLAGCGHG